MKRTTSAHQMAPVATGARPCAFAYGQRWAADEAALELISMAKPNGTTVATALGRPPV